MVVPGALLQQEFEAEQGWDMLIIRLVDPLSGEYRFSG